MSEAIRKNKDKAAELLAKGKLDAALQCYRDVLKVQPADVNVRQKVAEILQRTGRKEEAILQYQQVAGKYAVDGLLLKSIAICKVILQLDGKHTETQRALAELYAKHRGAATGPRTATLPASMTASLRPSGTPSPLHPSESAPAPAEARPAAPAPAQDESERLVITQDASPAEVPVEVEISEEIIIDLDESSDVAVNTGDIPHIPLFSELSPTEFMAMSERVQLRAFTAGDAIVTEGEYGTSMYAIVQGSVSVVRRAEDGSERVVAEMPEGAFFGEMALVADSPRLASVRAKEDCYLLEFTREKMEEIIREHPSVGQVIEQFYRERLLANLLRSNPIFKHFSNEEKQRITEAFKSRSVEPGELLLQQGQRGDGFYLLLRGRCDVVHQNADGTEQSYPQMREGDVFGEISLLLNQPVSATVRAATPCLVLRLQKQLFDELIIPNAEVRQMVTRLSTERLKRTQDLLTGTQEILTDFRV